MELLIILSLFNLAFSELTIIIINSDQTPESEWELLEANIVGTVKEVKDYTDYTQPVRILTFKAVSHSFSFEFDMLVNTIPHPLVYDLTYSGLLTGLISESCLRQNLVHFVLWNGNSYITKQRSNGYSLYTQGSFYHEAKRLYSIVEYFGWNNLAIVHDDQGFHRDIGDAIKELIKSPKHLAAEQIFTRSDSIEKIKNELFSNIKKNKARVVFVLAEHDLAFSIAKAADEIGISSSGYVWIFSGDAMNGISQTLLNYYMVSKKPVMGTGIIGLLPQSMNSNYLLFLSSTLAGTINYLSSSPAPDGKGLYSFFQSGVSFPNHYPYLKFDFSGQREKNFDFFNIQKFNNIKVGSWDSSKLTLEKSSQILWPGGSSEIPSDEYIPLFLALLHPGDTNSENSNIINGFDLAVEEINNDVKTLAGYVISPVYIQPYSSTQFIPGSLNMYENINIIGYVGPWGNELSESYADNIYASSDPKPLVSYQASSYVLNNSIEYPYFLRTVQSDGLAATVITIFLDFMKWKKIAVLYTDDNTGEGMYYSLLENLKTYDISIENSEKFRKIKSKFGADEKPEGETLDSIEKCLRNIVENQIKIVVYLSGSELTRWVTQEIKRKELYGKGYFWIGSGWITQEVIDGMNSTEELDTLQGFMSLGFRPPLGSAGEAFEQAYYEKYGQLPSSYSLSTYDSVFLFSKSLQSMIDAGQDFYQANLLMDFLRISDFQAASGSLKFSEGFNDRVLTGYSIFSMQDHSLSRVLQYDPVNSFQTEPNTSISWPGNSNSPPSDSWNSNFDCPFPENMSVSSENGLVTIIMIGIGLVLLALSISITHYNRSKKVVFEKIISKTGKTWKDTMVEMMILVEFFQFMAIAPRFKSLELFIVIISNVFMLDVIKILEAKSNYYWIMLSTVCALCFVWFFLMVFVILKKTRKFNGFPLLKKCFTFLITFFLPFFGNTLFLPTLAFLLDAFVCDHQVLGKAYVWRDCYMTCWTEIHIKYVILSGIAIMLYEPLAIICRPFWQEAPKDVHLKATSTFLLFKTCFQILLITVGKSLQGTFPLAHGITFSLLVLIFSISTYKFSAFNYHRCNLWQLTSLICLTFYSILATFSFIGDNTNFGWVIGLLFGWIMIVAVAYGIQCKYYPPLLFTEEKERESGKVDAEEVMPSLGKGNGVVLGELSKHKDVDASNFELEDEASKVHVTKNFDKTGN